MHHSTITMLVQKKKIVSIPTRHPYKQRKNLQIHSSHIVLCRAHTIPYSPVCGRVG